MADTVAVHTVEDNNSHTVVHLTCSSDGTGETGVKKVDITAVAKMFLLNNQDPKQPVGFRLEQARWNIQGFSSVQLNFERTAGNFMVLNISGSGYADWRGRDHGVRDKAKLGGILDATGEASADGKGSVLLSSKGPINGGTYDIDLWLAKSPT